MDISIIIAHFDPGHTPECIDSFYKVLKTIEDQHNSLNIEVLIADDGSPSHSEIVQLDTEIIRSDLKEIYHLSGVPLRNWLHKNNYPEIYPAHWLYLPKDSHNMCKARLWNHAADLAQSDILLFLDDDNYFLSNNSLQKVLDLMNDYDVVFGQVESKQGRIRDFSSHRVQGTSFAIKRELVHNIGGFGVWTESVSSGIDSDFWWKLYQYHTGVKELRVAYSSALRTVDSCSKRWKPFVGSFFRHSAVRKQFLRENGCKDYRSVKHNPSRNKSLWMDDLT